MYHIFRIHPFLRLFWAMLMALAGGNLIAHGTLTTIAVGLTLIAISVWVILGVFRRGRAYLSTWHG